MKLILTLAFSLLAISVFAQDTTYYNNNFKAVDSISNTYYEVKLKDPSDTNIVKLTTYFKSGQTWKEENYSDYKNHKLDGKQKEWFENGQFRAEIDYKNGEYHGSLLTYWKNGKPKRIDSYKKGKLISGECLNKEGIKIDHFEYKIYPEFIGDFYNYLAKKISYPTALKERGIEGRVVVGFIIENDGSITNIEILKSTNVELDEVAFTVIENMPNWKPALLDGEPVKEPMTLPIKFSLK